MITTPALILRIRDLVRDGDTRFRYDDDVYVRSAINPTLRELEQNSFTRSRTATITLVGGQADYPFLTTPNLSALGPIYAVERVSFGSSERPLRWKERFTHVGPPTTGEPVFWTLWNDGISFDPIPATGGEIVRLDVYCSPLVVTESSPPVDELQLTADIEDALVLGSAFRMALIDSEFIRARELRVLYAERLSALRAKMNPDRGDMPSVEDGSGMDDFIQVFI